MKFKSSKTSFVLFIIGMLLLVLAAGSFLYLSNFVAGPRNSKDDQGILIGVSIFVPGSVGGIVVLITSFVYFIRSIGDRVTANQTQKKIDKQQLQIAQLQNCNFTVSRIIDSVPYILIDSTHKCFALCQYDAQQPLIYKFSDILGFEKFENSSRIGHFERFSGTAYWEGHCKSLAVKIDIKDIECPFVYLNFVEHTTFVGSEDYNEAMLKLQDTLSTLKYMKYMAQ